MKPEDCARVLIDDLLLAAGWHICDMAQANIHAAPGVALREFPLTAGHGVADYLLYVNGKACGVIEAKKEGMPLKGVEVQSSRYAQGLQAALPAWRRPLPFLFESTAPLPPVAELTSIVAEIDRHLFIIRKVESDVDTNLKRAQALWQIILNKAFSFHL
jgi:hypothetical protein